MVNKKKVSVLSALSAIPMFLVAGRITKKVVDKKHQQESELMATESLIAKKLISEFKGIKILTFIRVSKIGDTDAKQYEFSVNNGPTCVFNDLGNPFEGRFGEDAEYLEKTPLNSKNRRVKKLNPYSVHLKRVVIHYQKKMEKSNQTKWSRF